MGLYRAGAARLGGPGSRPDLCRAAPQHSLCERGNGWWYQLRARITPSPWGPTAGARPGPWRMETRAVTYPGANSEPGREKAPTRPRGGRPWNVRVHPRAYLGHLLFFRRPQPAEGQVYTSQVVRRPPQRGRSSGQALSLLPCLLLRPVAQDGLGGGGTQGQRLEGPGPQEGKQEPPPPPGLQEPQARPLLDQGGPRGFGSESSSPHSQEKPDLRTCPRGKHGVGPERWHPPESSWHHSYLSDSHVGTVPAEPARSPPGGSSSRAGPRVRAARRG